MARRESEASFNHVARLITGRQIHPFDFINSPIFYDPKPEPHTEYARRLYAQVKLGYVAATEVSRDLKKLFVPCAMSNGHLAYRLALDYGDTIRSATEAKTGTPFLTTQGLRHFVAGQELMDRVIHPNRLANHAFIDRLERKFPDFAIVGPVDSEGPLRVQRGNNALSQGATYQDWTFENKYLPRVVDCDAMVLGLDHAWSRYANVEEFLGDVIQCGLLDRFRVRPGRDFDIMDENGAAIPLADRAWERARHIVDVVEKGFRTDLAVAVLAAQFQIDDWLRDGDGPIDRRKLHPVLKHRSSAELERMDALKAVMLPYLAEKCLPWARADEDPHLQAYFERAVVPHVGKPAENPASALFAYSPLGGFDHPERSGPRQGRLLADTFMTSARAPKRRGTEGDYFKRPARLFDDGHYAKLPIWEQAALPYIAGFMEDHRLPESAPRSAFYARSPKGGNRAAAFAAETGRVWLREAQSANDPSSGEGFFARVIAPNRRDLGQEQRLLAQDATLKQAGFGTVVSTANFLNIREGMAKFRHAVAAKGADTLSSKAHLALMMEWFDRNAEAVILAPGWENHHEDVQMAVRGVQHAVGLVDRPYEGGRFRMDIIGRGADGSLRRLDLHDLIATLGARVESYLDADKGQDPADAPAPARNEILALARLLQISDMRADPGRMNGDIARDPSTGLTTRHEVIEWHNVDQGLTWFWNRDARKRADLLATPVGQDAPSLRDRLRGKLLETGVLYLAQDDLKGLDEDYEGAWRTAHGGDMLGRRRAFDDHATKVTWRGPA